MDYIDFIPKFLKVVIISSNQTYIFESEEEVKEKMNTWIQEHQSIKIYNVETLKHERVHVGSLHTSLKFRLWYSIPNSGISKELIHFD